jgi:hypothetical protein
MLAGACGSAGGARPLDSEALTTTTGRVDVPNAARYTVPAGDQGKPDSDPGVARPDPDPTLPSLAGVDEWCRAVGQVRGSAELLGLAWSFGGPDRASLAEVVAAPLVLAATSTIRAAWPPSLAAEEEQALRVLVVPYERRLGTAMAAAERVGMTPAQRELLVAAWSTVLAGQRRDDPDLAALRVPEAVAGEVTAAAGAVRAGRPPWFADPDLVPPVLDVPATDAYVVAECGAVGDLGLLDEI